MAPSPHLRAPACSSPARAMMVRLPPHGLRSLPEGSLYIFQVLSGAARLRGDGAAPRIEEGEQVLIPERAAAVLEAREPEPLVALLLELPPEVVLLAGHGDLPAGRLGLPPHTARLLHRTLLWIEFETVSAEASTLGPRIDLALRALELAAPTPGGNQALPNGGPAPDGRARMRGYVAALEHRAHEAHDLDQAARQLDLSRRRFTELFRERTGSAWQPYVRRVRVRNALRLLERGGVTVEAVAFACGYDDPSTFYRAFRREMGTTPQAWCEARA